MHAGWTPTQLVLFDEWSFLWSAVLDYGAVGDGVTDNVNAFQDALNTAVNGGTGKGKEDG